MSWSSLQVAETLPCGSATLDLLGRANIWVADSLADRSSLEFSRWIIHQAAQLTAPGQIEISVFDQDLSGIAAPFSALNTGGEKLLHFVTDELALTNLFDALRSHIQGVNNVMQARTGSLVDYRKAVGYPVEGYKLIVLSADISTLNEENQNKLSVLLRAGPNAGVSFLIHSMTLGVNPFLVGMCDEYRLQHGLPESTEIGPLTDWSPLPAEQVIFETARLAHRLASAKMDTIPFDFIQPTTELWRGNSADGITFAIGRYGSQIVEITLGDELNQRHNLLVTGAVGQGKSNLISIIIHSLCQRYSPAELELYLLDFKEGVTLQPFAGFENGHYLPHARVLGLEADREFGLSVFEHLFAVYRARMKQFKTHGVQSLKQYRAKYPNAKMPRILAIIDEFQMMFNENDRLSSEIADLLIKGVRLFRACGIHVILASQTIGGNTALMGSAGDGLFGQVPVRIALKNSLAESHATLGIKNDAAVYLRSREAIVNLEYGEESANRKTSIAFADEGLLGTLREDWWKKANIEFPPPVVFAGEDHRSICADIAKFPQLSSSDRHPPRVFLGNRIDVTGKLLAPTLANDIGRNVALIGSGPAVPVLANIALALAWQVGPKATFIFLDLLGDEPSWENNLRSLLDALHLQGSRTNLVTGIAASNRIISTLGEEINNRVDHAGQTIFLFGLGLERIRNIQPEFAGVCKQGPPLGIHVITWWKKFDAFREQVGYGGESSFDIRLCLRLEPQLLKQLVNDPLLEWSPADNRMLVTDSSELDRPTKVIPYLFFDTNFVQNPK